jgi:hypothetical protein
VDHAKFTFPPSDSYGLPVAVSRIIYTLVKIRGHKIISRFLPNQPVLLESVTSLFYSSRAIGIDTSWELRYIVLLWLSHLLLAPFDLITISIEDHAVVEDLSILDGTGLVLPGLPHLSRRLLALGLKYLSSPGNRESDAAALLLLRISLRVDMRKLGLLDTMVAWGTRVVSEASEDPVNAQNSLFLKTGVLAVLAGFLAQGESNVVQKFVPGIFQLVSGLQDDDQEEWTSAGVRRLGMKIYRWVATLTLTHPSGEDYTEDIIERLLNALGDRDTAVRFGASKSLAVVARNLDPDMAGDVLEAVMGVYEEDLFFDPPIASPGQKHKRRKVLTAVSPEKWHGATLTLATFLRQRAVRSTDVMARVVECIIEALSFEQRRSTFAVGGNVRDAACYAAWSLARSYSTTELDEAGDIVVAVTQFEEGRKVIQLLATELVVAGSLDPLGNVRRAASASLQELVGRHSGCVHEGITLVQTVDYNAVALRRRSVVQVAHNAALLGEEYWKGLVYGLATGWRGIGGSDDDGRKLAATSLRAMVEVSYPSGAKDSIYIRGKFVLRAVLERTLAEGQQHVEIYHGCLWALAEVLDGLRPLHGGKIPILDNQDKQALHCDIFSKLKGHEFINPVLRPELTAEATSRVVRSLAIDTPDILEPNSSSWRLWTAILEASLDRPEDSVLDQAVPAAKALLEKLSSLNRHLLVDDWCVKIMDPGYRRRGHILVLGEVLADVSNDTIDLHKVTKTLISAACRAGMVEIRVAGVKALGRVTVSDRMVLKTIVDALDDYAIELRGDVGSWVRSEAITAILTHWERSRFESIPDDLKWEFMAKLVRLSAEKLDRLRLQAGEALLTISPILQQDIFSSTDLAQLSQWSPEEYFTHLVPILTIPRLREPFLEGYVTSASSGSDSVLKASRHALLHHLSNTAFPITEELLAIFRRAVDAPSDRIVQPLLDILFLLLDTSLLPLTATWSKKLFFLVQKAHFKSTSIPKLTAAVKVYRSLALVEGASAVKAEVVKKLVGMLMHPFPRVRMEAADAVYLLTAEGGGMGVAEVMERVDWGASTKVTKEEVMKVKEGLVKS